MKEPTAPDTLATRPDVGRMLGISRERVRQIEDQDDFPAPEDVVDEGRTPIWARHKIETYKGTRNTAHGRRAAPEPAPAEG